MITSKPITLVVKRTRNGTLMYLVETHLLLTICTTIAKKDSKKETDDTERGR